jgi:phosphoribosyl 1,2-cyclic phosphodiesterase
VILNMLGSGSRGNALALTADGFTLLVDAGFSLRSLKRRARYTGLNLARVGAVLLTHEHGDHARSGPVLAAATGATLFASGGTLDQLGVAGEVLSHLETVIIGPFSVTACRVAHDAAEPVALSVVGPEGHKLGIAYDLGHTNGVLRYLLRHADCLVIEANHDEAMLRASTYPPSVRYRIGGPDGHLSNRAAATFLGELAHAALSTVVLAHLSEQCNQPALAAGVTGEVLRGRGFGGALVVAEQDDALEPIPL